MKTSTPKFAFIVALLASAGFAQEQKTPAPAAVPAPVVTVPPASVPASQQLAASLPKYDPQIAAAAEKAKAAEPKPGDPVKPMTNEEIARLADPDNADPLILPTMKVQQRPRPRLSPDFVATPKAAGDNMLKKSSQLDQALNKFTLPLFGTSAAARARDEKERAKNAQMQQDVKQISDALKQADPAEARALKDAISKD